VKNNTMNHKLFKDYKVRKDLLLADYTKLKIGGKANYLAEIGSQHDLVALYRICQTHGIRFLTLGHGSNIFFSDLGFSGLVAIIRFNCVRFNDETTIIAEAGATLKELNDLCLDKSLTGFEFSSGIPGTVGGAVYGNAGAYGKCIGDCLIGATILTQEGTVKNVDNSFFQFSYRSSSLKTNHGILLEASFSLRHGDQDTIKNRVAEVLAMRAKKLPPENTPTAGSYFKNIEIGHHKRMAAAIYLDEIGSKQTSVGDAAVWRTHANIFYNKGNATAKNILALEKILKKRVFEKFGILLEREVMYFE
jgi:UDP-N-acetylmuramate dehydrogenase